MINPLLMAEYVKIKRKTGNNQNGRPAYGDPVRSIAWVTRKTKTLKRKDGTDIQSAAQVSLPPGVVVEPQDVIILRDGANYEVQDVDQVKGLYGMDSHRKAYL